MTDAALLRAAEEAVGAPTRDAFGALVWGPGRERTLYRREATRALTHPERWLLRWIVRDPAGWRALTAPAPAPRARPASR
jgi:hypothetical protein